MRWKNPWYNPQLSHHLPDGFRNTEPAMRQPGDVQRWRQERKAQKLPNPPGDGYSAFIERWWQQADLSGNDDRVWWLGHASLLLRLNGYFLLTDPVFSRRASPVSFAGPARRTEIPLDLNQLPRLDAVLISHNHYDHLDKKTVRSLIKRFPDVHFFVPLGLKTWFSRRGTEQVTELDWWQSFNWCGMVFTAVLPDTGVCELFGIVTALFGVAGLWSRGVYASGSAVIRVTPLLWQRSRNGWVHLTWLHCLSVLMSLAGLWAITIWIRSKQ